jgi:PPOX class probable F420-dependent enzyme
MPPPPLPPRIEAIVRRANPAVVATLRPDGTPHTAATWYDLEDDGRVLLNMDNSRLRLRFLRQNPAVALTVLDAESWYRHVSLLGRIVEIADDEGLAGIDRLARRYVGSEYSNRTSPRTNAWMEVESWHAWDASGGRILTHADMTG